MADSEDTKKGQNEGPLLLFVGTDLPPALEEYVFLQGAHRPLLTVDNAESAMEALARQEVALVLAHAAADAGGYALCERIRSQPDMAGAPVILFAATISLHDVLRALQSGVDALLPLPGSAGLVSMHVEQVLESVKNEAPASANLLFGHTHITSPLSGARVSNLLLSCLCHGSSNLLRQLQEFDPSGLAAANGDNGAESSQSLRLLVAEDNPTNRFYLTRLLENMGHEVTSVENGREAVVALSKERYDAVLMDIQMPVLNGIEALRQIRQGQKVSTPRIPVLAITAHGIAGDREALFRQGFDDYLSKPVEPEDIRASLARVLRGAARPHTSPTMTPTGKAPASARETQPPAQQKLAVSGADSYVLDRNKTLQRLKDTEFVDKLYTTFLADLDSRVAALCQAEEQKDLPLLCKLEHTLKGAVSVLDAQKARDLAYSLECAARKQDQQTARDCLEELRAALETLRCGMERCLSQRQEGAT